MLSRRQFLAAAPAGAALMQSAAAQSGLPIRHVDIVHHTHTDVGYTALPSTVRDLQKRYLDVAVDACQADPAFRWTVESLVGLDDWWRASSPARRLQLTAMVEAGRMDVMAMPFNQTPFLNARQWRQMMAWIPDSVWKAMNVRAAMQNDVNGFPRAGAMALMDRGIHRFLMGLNPDSGGPPFRRPSAFWWKMSAKEVEITARKPASTRAQGACSREDPQPKLAPATSTCAPLASGRFRRKSGFGEPSSWYRQSLKSFRPRPSLVVILRKRAGIIWSVSMLVRGRTAMGLSKVVKGFMRTSWDRSRRPRPRRRQR